MFANITLTAWSETQEGVFGQKLLCSTLPSMFVDFLPTLFEASKYLSSDLHFFVSTGFVPCLLASGMQDCYEPQVTQLTHRSNPLRPIHVVYYLRSSLYTPIFS